jgi:hypothetical protein
MINKIAAVGVWASFLSLYIASYVLAGFKGLAPSLLITAIWAAMAWIIKVDRDKIAEELSLYKAEVWNLRLGIKKTQEAVYTANSRLGDHVPPVALPEIMPSLLPSVFDQNKSDYYPVKQK